jgi:hypothetical protein
MAKTISLNAKKQCASGLSRIESQFNAKRGNSKIRNQAASQNAQSIKKSSLKNWNSDLIKI